MTLICIIVKTVLCLHQFAFCCDLDITGKDNNNCTIMRQKSNFIKENKSLPSGAYPNQETLLSFPSAISDSSMVLLLWLLCIYAPWMPLHMDRLSILNCADFQVNLAHLFHFYYPSAWRSALDSLCHAIHNNVSADPLAGKNKQNNFIYMFSNFVICSSVGKWLLRELDSKQLGLYLQYRLINTLPHCLRNKKHSHPHSHLN